MIRIFTWVATLCAAILAAPAIAQLTTSDIPRFYAALDALATARTHADSVAVVQREYLDGGSAGLRLFDKARDLSAERLLDVMRSYLAYYASIRGTALALDRNADSITAVLEDVRRVLPGFEIPPVTIAFGVLNTGGTAVGQHILLGAGMISGGPAADVHELPAYLVPFVTGGGGLGDVATLAAHEAVHTWQRDWPLGGLVTRVLHEGVPDFVVYDLLRRPAGDAHHVFGAAHECAVWREFEADLADGGRGRIDRWLYNAHLATPERPGDLGYFVGRRIAAAYYAQAEDKTSALRDLSKPRKYRQVVRLGSYDGTCGGD